MYICNAFLIRDIFQSGGEEQDAMKEGKSDEKSREELQGLLVAAKIRIAELEYEKEESRGADESIYMYIYTYI